MLTNAANMWLIMNGGFPGENEATKTFEGEKNDLVPDYVDEWPMNPYSNKRDYVVTITKTVVDGSERYSIAVTSE